MTKQRQEVPKLRQASVLIACRRRCCLCSFWNENESEQDGQIAHIDHDPSNASEDNLVYLCLRHHNQYDSTGSQAKRIMEDEVRRARAELSRQFNCRSQPSVTITFKLYGEFESFSDEDVKNILAILKKHSGPDSKIEFVMRKLGSVLLTFKVEAEDALRLMKALDAGNLKEAGVVDVVDARISGRDSPLSVTAGRERLVNIVYVRIRADEDGLPSEVETLREWTWCRSPFVRWKVAMPDDIEQNLINHAALIVLNWPAHDAPTAKAAYDRIRRTRKDAKVLVIKSGDEPNRDGIVPDKARSGGTNVDPHAYSVFAEELCGKEVQDAFKRVGQALHISLPLPTVHLNIDDKDLSLSELRKWVGDERLRLIVQKFFPDATKAQVCSVGGGWSGAKLCRLFVDGGSQLYFLKFSKDEEQYEQDFTNHIEAKKWLGDAAVDLKLVPAQGGSFRRQQQAFPLRKPLLLPLCFLSASTHQHPRETLHALYRTRPQNFLEKAFGRLIATLGANQPAHKESHHSTPWSNIERDPFFLSEEMVRNALAAMDDLKLYGPSFCQNNSLAWEQLCQRIAALFGAKLPAWLSNPLPVVLGHTHGDPNPRNCLVHPDDPLDMQWIDCGDYRADGRLVSDLAIVERDIKLVLLGTEKEVNGFFDLDVRQIPDWCYAEHDSIEKGISYNANQAPGSAEKPSAVYRAYRLIGLVRQRAQEIDPEGKHYFAALLFWTLDALKYKAVRPTKKLLALFSASEILRKF